MVEGARSPQADVSLIIVTASKQHVHRTAIAVAIAAQHSGTARPNGVDHHKKLRRWVRRRSGLQSTRRQPHTSSKAVHAVVQSLVGR